MKCFTVDRTQKIVNAKVHFARLVKLDYPHITATELAKFLRVDHTTILFYWYKSKAIITIEPLYYRLRERKTTNAI